MIKRLLAVSAAFALAACGGQPNVKDPKAVASAFASAYARQDLNALSALMTNEGKNVVSMMAMEGEDGPTRANFFNDETRMAFAAAVATNGASAPPRYNPDGEVWMKVADTPDGLLTVRLTQIGESFWVKDAGVVDPATYNALSTTPPAAPKP